ncbi:MAG: T9SS type A sorting domain-containing protein [Bacteroidetes bacterium SB0668_bin_1]|nr:T9SS type A sorting domain-containing protein [Bacteroidetes bacterium SB0668_bin_1]
MSDDTTGSGPVLSLARGLAVEADGSLVVAYMSERGPRHRVLMRVDPVSGDRMIISDDTTGSGPNLLHVIDLVVESNGSIVALDGRRKAVMRIDPVSGDRMIVSDDTTGSGPIFSLPSDLAIETDGNFVVPYYIGAYEEGMVALVRIDPVSGDRTVFSFSSVVTGIEDEAEVPERFSLTGAYPNPFRATTRIGYELQRPSSIELVVYDAAGREVEVLVSSMQPAGLYEASFEAEGLPNGVYFYRLSAGYSTQTGQVVLFR